MCGAKGEIARPPVLPCDEECVRLERNRRLAAALEIKQLGPIVFGASHVYEPDLVEFALNNLEFIRRIEKDFACLLAGKEQQLYMVPMKSHLRKAVHALATHYTLDTTSIDPEPKRSVVVTRSRLSLAPAPLLSQVASSNLADSAAFR